MKKIKNAEVLLGSGCRGSRQIVMDILDEVWDRIDSYRIMKNIMKVSEDGVLSIGEKCWDLNKIRHLYVIGAGKAVNAMAKAADEILGDWITDGIAICKFPEDDHFDHIRLRTGGHPLPNEGGYKASLEILDLVAEAGPEDLFLGLMSGGCSSLMSCPMEGMTLEEEKLTRDVMLKSGANIVEVNSVARHVSRVNGGKLAKRIEEQGSELITLLIMDAMGFPESEPDKPVWFGFTPLAPDATTLQTAKDAIEHYQVADKLPKIVTDFFKNCSEKDETPKNLKRWTGYLISTLPDMTKLVQEAAEKRGLNFMLLTNSLQGEAKEVGTVMASIAEEIQISGRPVKAPCIVTATGEMSVRIPEIDCGLGGPGQEMTTSFAIQARKLKGVCIASVDSEGTDGPTIAAGGLTDSETFGLAEKAGIDLYKALREHDVYPALDALGCEIITGNTGTNLCDLHVMYVPEA